MLEKDVGKTEKEWKNWIYIIYTQIDWPFFFLKKGTYSNEPVDTMILKFSAKDLHFSKNTKTRFRKTDRRAIIRVV